MISTVWTLAVPDCLTNNFEYDNSRIPYDSPNYTYDSLSSTGYIVFWDTANAN